MNLRWYLRRLSRMSPQEALGRARNAGWSAAWALPYLRPTAASGLIASTPEARIGLEAAWKRATPPSGRAVDATIDAAERVLEGEWTIFGVPVRWTGAAPDWFRDPLSGQTAPKDRYALGINHRDASLSGNVKACWELSRQQPAILLSAAWWLSGEDRFAEAAAGLLSSWWEQNPFLRGIHWTSAIEVGLRLLAWSWIRALLHDWPGRESLFDGNELFIRQLYDHQVFLDRFHSHGSSSNNHLLTELAGLGVSAAAFPWFRQSERWAEWAFARLDDEVQLQTASDGLNREHAASYHRSVLELLIATGLARSLAGRDPTASFWQVVRRMADALAGICDGDGRMARYGDDDDAWLFPVDAPEHDRCRALVGAVDALMPGAGPPSEDQDSVLRAIALSCPRPGALSAAEVRPRGLYPESGQAILALNGGERSIWLRCDHAPLGYLSIAAHGHADALSIELRVDGSEVLIDPGTYCYHGEPEWRRYFKGTSAHNSLVIDGEDQAVYGGPFLWLSRTEPVLEFFDDGAETGRPAWQARHNGYERLGDPVTHHRRVELASRGEVMITDWIQSEEPHEAALSFHLGEEVEASLADGGVRLAWPEAGRASMELPASLAWRMHRGETDPPLGWVSRRFGHRRPTTVIVGRGQLHPGERLQVRISLGAED